MGTKKGLVWAPAAPIIKPDNIVSSEARANNVNCFVASYENDPKVWMNHLMTNEYMRIWYSERDKRTEIYLAEMEALKKHFLKRRFVLRSPATMKKPIRELRIIKMKSFQNIPAKVDTWRRKAVPELKPPNDTLDN